jgi:hypothetical protein
VGPRSTALCAVVGSTLVSAGSVGHGPTCARSGRPLLEGTWQGSRVLFRAPELSRRRAKARTRIWTEATAA